MREKVRFFKALGDVTRLKIVRCLLKKDYCACDFTSIINKNQTTVSRHLKILANAGIIKYEKKGRNIIYSIKNKDIKKILSDFGIKKMESCCKKEEVAL